MCRVLLAVIGLFCAGWLSPTRADEPKPDLPELLDSFSERFREQDWQPKKAGSAGYMRPLDDAGWQARMSVLQALVRHPKEAVPVLLETLQGGEPPQRILAAQALGYLGTHVPAQPLIDALRDEKDAAVRLYLVDALGMTGQGDRVDWDQFLKQEENRDIRRHVDYVRQRGGKPLDDAVRKTLAEWDARQMNTAELGRPAPDFSLTSAQGKQISLSDYRGKQPVVLVFVYGDT